MTKSGKGITIVGEKETVMKLIMGAEEKTLPKSHYLNEQLEKYADKNNLEVTEGETSAVYQEVQLNLENMSDKAIKAYMHLQNEMFDKLLNVDEDNECSGIKFNLFYYEKGDFKLHEKEFANPTEANEFAEEMGFENFKVLAKSVKIDFSNGTFDFGTRTKDIFEKRN